MNNTVTIPKKLANQDDLVILPRKEYEALLEFKIMKTFVATPTVRRALRRSEQNLKRGHFLTYNDFASKLGTSR